MSSFANGDIIPFDELRRGDVARVGGKNASLGEMVHSLGSKGVRVPAGFATTANAYWRFIDANELRVFIAQAMNEYDSGKASLAETGQAIRRAILRGDWPAGMAKNIREAYQDLCQRSGKPEI